jgi:hypothetical protein
MQIDIGRNLTEIILRKKCEIYNIAEFSRNFYEIKLCSTFLNIYLRVKSV